MPTSTSGFNLDQLLGKRFHAIDAARSPSMLDIDVLVSGPSQLIELLTKSFVVNRLIAFALGIQHADEPKLVRSARSRSQATATLPKGER